MSFVLDSSIVATWCFEDERSPGGDRLFERLCRSKAFVPSHWPLEVTNMLVQAERKKRIRTADANERLDLLYGLPIELDLETGSRSWTDILRLARDERLTSYDAAYLDLVLRRGCPLATKDHELARAAQRRSVELLPA